MSQSKWLLNNTFHDELSGFYSHQTPTSIQNPQLVILNESLAETLNIPPKDWYSEHLLDILSGKSIPKGGQPIAQKYSGHQFGNYNPELGDGRGILLGEIVTQTGNKYDLHLKGAGQTPYSRFGDGRAVLRSSIREFLASEALHSLGIPTTRALAIVTSTEPVQREKTEYATTLLRVCESHIRFGHFENFFYLGQQDKLKQLLDYCIKYHFPEAQDSASPALHFFQQVVHSTAEMVAKWQAFGFAHGVMNTDNMSILGLTFDFGPYGFLDDYDPGFICNHSDHYGRYAFDQQPGVALWNLNALGHSLSNFLNPEQLKSALSEYEPALIGAYATLMRQKLGLSEGKKSDQTLLASLFTWMEKEKADYTSFFRNLSTFDEKQSTQSFCDDYIYREELQAWLNTYIARLSQEDTKTENRHETMLKKNPKFILRNYLAQNVIESAEKGDYTPLKTLHKILQNPYDTQSKYEDMSNPPPEWGKHLEISCSS
ncbi:protein adenylyltransferase SelO [Algicola sagamiensis]|uniref:protein adenylyltransferase SelO n=1 Tax=Algicola sagamiensis TaxID=163869 RepID=UPI00036F0BE5|nr:YdiU family protein [Algicola sagamiensis]